MRLERTALKTLADPRPVARHTPGPWTIHEDTVLTNGGGGDGEPMQEIVAADGLVIARLSIYSTLADGRVMAAAPEGLDLAIAVVEYFGSDPIHPSLQTDIKLRDMARALLAKIERQL